MKIYRNIIITVVIIAIIVLPKLIYDTNNFGEMSLNYPVTEEHYNYLRECALKYASTLDKNNIESDEIKIDSQYDNNALNVTVNSRIATVKASYPISMKLEKNANGVEAQGKIVYGNVEYTEISKVHPKYLYVLGVFLISCLIAFVVYMLFYMFPCEFIWKSKKNNLTTK